MSSRRRSLRAPALIWVAAAAFSGCTITPGPSPYRREERPFYDVDELEEPGGLFTITPARRPTAACPACGEENPAAAAECAACKAPLVPPPDDRICPACKGTGKVEGEPCEACEGLGRVHPRDE